MLVKLLNLQIAETTYSPHLKIFESRKIYRRTIDLLIETFSIRSQQFAILSFSPL